MEAEQWFVVRQEESDNLRRQEVLGKNLIVAFYILWKKTLNLHM